MKTAWLLGMWMTRSLFRDAFKWLCL